MLKLGIIGLGPWGQKYIQTVADRSDMQIVAACRKTNERPNFLPEGCAFYTNWHELLRKNLDGLILSSDPYTNLEIAKTAVNLGIPILIEKPVAFHVKDIEYLMKCDNVLALVLVNYTHLFSPAFIKLQELVKDKDIVEIDSRGYSKRPPRIFSSVWDYAPHDLSMAISLLDSDLIEPQYIEKKYSIDEGSNYQIELKYYHKYLVKHTMVVGNAGPTKERYFEVNCADGARMIYNDQINDKLTLNGKVVPIENTQPLDNALSCFKKLIEGDTDIRAGWILSKKITKILEQCDNL